VSYFTFSIFSMYLLNFKQLIASKDICPPSGLKCSESSKFSSLNSTGDQIGQDLPRNHTRY